MNKQNFKSLVKRLVTVGVATVMLFVVFISVGCTYWETDYQWSEDSFYFSVTADREYAKVGETVELTVTFKNLSGRNLLTTVSITDMRIRAQLENIFWIGDVFQPIIRSAATLRIPQNAIVTKTWSQEIWYYFDCDNMQHIRNSFICRAIFHIGVTNHGDSYYWEESRTVLLEYRKTINIIEEGIQHE